MGRPSIQTSPVVGCSNPAMRRRVVVFPEPEAPRIVMNSAGATASETSSTAAKAPKRFVTRRSSTRDSVSYFPAFTAFQTS